MAFGAGGRGALEFPNQSSTCLGGPGLNSAPDQRDQGIVDRYKISEKYNNHYKDWMERTLLIMWSRVIYIHEGSLSSQANADPNAGCIHFAPGNAGVFHSWVDQPRRIPISLESPTSLGANSPGRTEQRPSRPGVLGIPDWIRATFPRPHFGHSRTTSACRVVKRVLGFDETEPARRIAGPYSASVEFDSPSALSRAGFSLARHLWAMVLA